MRYNRVTGSSTTRLLSLVTVGIGTAVSAVVSAPAASAEVTNVSVIAGPDGLLTGCPYTVVAVVTTPPYEPGAVVFFNDGQWLSGFGDYHPENHTVTNTWTPQRTGGQDITAVQTDPGGFNTRRYIRVNVVGAGINTGSGCARTS